MKYNRKTNHTNCFELFIAFVNDHRVPAMYGQEIYLKKTYFYVGLN